MPNPDRVRVYLSRVKTGGWRAECEGYWAEGGAEYAKSRVLNMLAASGRKIRWVNIKQREAPVEPILIGGYRHWEGKVAERKAA